MPRAARSIATASRWRERLRNPLLGLDLLMLQRRGALLTPLAAFSVAEAMEDAGLNAKAMTRDQLRGIGVIVGSGGGSQDFTEEQYRLYYTGKLKQCSVYTIPTSTIGTLASEVSMRFGFRGLSHIVSTGCTSSTDALGYAFHNIQSGMLDTIVAGGVDAPIMPLILR